MFGRPTLSQVASAPAGIVLVSRDGGTKGLRGISRTMWLASQLAAPMPASDKQPRLLFSQASSRCHSPHIPHMFRENEPLLSMASNQAQALDDDFMNFRLQMRSAALEMGYKAVAAAVPSSVLPQLSGDASHVVFVLLPDEAEPHAAGLLSGVGRILNIASEDLMRCVTCFVLRAGERTLRLSSGLFHTAAAPSDRSMVVILSAGNTVVRRRLVPESLDDFSAELQAAEIGSGPNYAPWRTYSDDELGEAQSSHPTECDCSVLEAEKCYQPHPLSYGIEPDAGPETLPATPLDLNDEQLKEWRERVESIEKSIAERARMSECWM